ncbi:MULTISPECIES: hypothetical protein [Paenibacillus]|uniref:hypothetical protein n=1 Tax=Paenibacillus TaxID=44249 RepID=UPI0002F3BD0B|nr:MULTISPECIES: hypothetical protein [Paenibacillus]KKD52993.1 hypothetical protein C400_21560 [Paenibacillus sp. ICGEB2008]UNL93281.1 hypothetical protein CPY53_06710 [Paenibacillus polymyxa]
MNSNIKENIKFNKMRNNNLFSGCIHQDEFCNRISRAHSIQNNGILNKLSRNSEVMAIDFSKVYLDKGNFKLFKVGRDKASTFTGFCNHHDSSIFSPIENNDYKPTDSQHNFLFAYRAFALGYYERYSAYQLIKARVEDDPRNLHTELGARYRLYDDHLKVIENYKIIMNKYLDNSRFDRITTDVLIWPQEYGFASTSMFFIEKDNEGKTINKMNSYISPFFFTFFPHAGKTYVLMSYFTKDKSKYRFIRDQILTLSMEEQRIAISNLIALYIENVFISPDLWDNLPSSTREKYYQICNTSKGKTKPNKLVAFKNFNLFV